MRLLFVCLGNICRSPTAEAVMRQILRDADLQTSVQVDSAGTGGWHVGEPADARARAAALRRGIAIDGTARQVSRADLDHFDLVLAADATNRRELLRLAGDDPGRRAKVKLLREFDGASARSGKLDVPDPYYGDGDGFELVLDIVDAACRGLLGELRASGRV